MAMWRRKAWRRRPNQGVVVDELQSSRLRSAGALARPPAPKIFELSAYKSKVRSPDEPTPLCRVGRAAWDKEGEVIDEAALAMSL
eukprot:7188286-Heterocapsa_arctica.AAC.1